MSEPPTTISVVLPRGEAIRNFVYSGCLEALQAEVPLDVHAVLPTDDVRSLLTERFGSVEELEAIGERYPVRIARDMLDMAHGRWLGSAAAVERRRRHDLAASAKGRRGRRELKKMLCWPFANRPGLRLLSGAERLTSRALRTSDRYTRHFEACEPALLFNGSHVHSSIATPAVQAAQWLGVPTATFLFSWDNLTSQGRILLPYDHYLVWNEAIRADLLRIYPHIDPAGVFVTGTPQFDPHFDDTLAWSREAYAAEVGVDPSRPTVLYTTGMPNHMPFEEEIVEGIADAIEPLGAQLIVRVYPKDRSGRFDELKARRADIAFPHIPWEPRWLTPAPEDTPLWSNMLRHADVGINVASTVSLELCMFDKPTINVAFNPPSLPTSEIEYAGYYDFDHYAQVIATGAIDLVREPEAMRGRVAQALEHPELGREQREGLVSSFFGDSLDGHVGTRIAKLLASLARA